MWIHVSKVLLAISKHLSLNEISWDNGHSKPSRKPMVRPEQKNTALMKDLMRKSSKRRKPIQHLWVGFLSTGNVCLLVDMRRQLIICDEVVECLERSMQNFVNRTSLVCLTRYHIRISLNSWWRCLVSKTSRIMWRSNFCPLQKEYYMHSMAQICHWRWGVRCGQGWWRTRTSLDACAYM